MIVWQCDHDRIAVWQFVIVTYNIILNPNSKFQTRKWIENKIKIKMENKNKIKSTFCNSDSISSSTTEVSISFSQFLE